MAYRESPNNRSKSEGVLKAGRGRDLGIFVHNARSVKKTSIAALADRGLQLLEVRHRHRHERQPRSANAWVR